MKTPAEGHQIPITNATKEQLRAFANHLGLKTSNFDTEDKLRQRIAGEGYNEPHIIVFANAPTKAAEAQAIASGDAVAEPMVNMTLYSSPGAGGKRGLFVGVNGKAIIIPRDKPCDVKLRYWEALNNAIETKYEYDEDAKANVPREVHSYPFQVHKSPADADIAAWRAFEAAEEARIAEQTRAAKKAA